MFTGLLKTMRPRQWPKNGFVFVALFFDEKLLNPVYLGRTVAAFVLLCLMSSAVYLMNDLSDIESDRQHPTKRLRPLPAGQLSPTVAALAAVIFAGGSLIAGYVLSPLFALILLIYLLSQIAYTYWLKNVVLFDVMIVALGFVLRIASGVAVIEVERFSPWLYLFGGFLALFLVLGKRRHELVLLGEDAEKHRKILQEYNLDLIDRMLGLVTTSVLVFYSLYTFLAEGLPANHTMMLTIPFLMYGIFRYMYLIHVRHEGGAPEEIALRDRPLQVTIALFALTVFVVIYIF
ncbi:MAG: decaprenyl-phosphate phosphoribosyltransferase [Chloroflexi bacterium]|nr:decaprenyl-phosphate phosphoribosyltransferase [Ardenticatenaceae bacterium]MBL1130324.1 decaprenyl-phosphate phosphoribosyltransferase [Chloroflexota bacterium]NOG36415.1 decaprenyl-phosphate phosphoribosyltransferase [Chloroflexota bacterium]GIK57821.1 MAG: decaprenyl-phosphate phosphoribosyltransferase [Chloroflexota bacterium]